MFKLVTTALVGGMLALGLAISQAVSAPPTLIDKASKTVGTSAPEHLIKVKGCHSNAKHHWVGKWGTKAWHRHGYNCKPQPVKKKKWGKKKWGHCHKAWKKHWHGGWGGGWHRHAGPKCKYRKGKSGYYNKGNGCIKIGNVWICA